MLPALSALLPTKLVPCYSISRSTGLKSTQLPGAGWVSPWSGAVQQACCICTMVFVCNLYAAEHETGNKDPCIWSPAALLNPQILACCSLQAVSTEYYHVSWRPHTWTQNSQSQAPAGP